MTKRFIETGFSEVSPSGLRQNAEKSREPITASLASCIGRTSSGVRTCHAVAAMNGSGVGEFKMVYR